MSRIKKTKEQIEKEIEITKQKEELLIKKRKKLENELQLYEFHQFQSLLKDKKMSMEEAYELVEKEDTKENTSTFNSNS